MEKIFGPYLYEVAHNIRKEYLNEGFETSVFIDKGQWYLIADTDIKLWEPEETKLPQRLYFND